MGDHHDRVARADAEEGDEADERAEGERAASGEDGQHAADESEGKVGQHEEQVARVAKDDAEQQDDADARDGGVPEQFAFSAGLGEAGAAKGRINASGKGDLGGDLLLHFRHEGGHVAPGDVAGDLLAALGAFVGDRVAARGGIRNWRCCAGACNGAGPMRQREANGDTGSKDSISSRPDEAGRAHR